MPVAVLSITNNQLSNLSLSKVQKKVLEISGAAKHVVSHVVNSRANGLYGHDKHAAIDNGWIRNS